MITQAQSTTFFRLLLLLAIAAAVTMALLPHPPQVLASWKDKYQHMLAFAVLAGLFAHAYPREPLFRIGERLSFLGALIEVLQSIPSLHRDCDIWDWIADTAAIAAMLSVVALVRYRRRRRRGLP